MTVHMAVRAALRLDKIRLMRFFPTYRAPESGYVFITGIINRD